MPDLFTFSSSALPDDAVLLCFRLIEAINTPYELELFFTTKQPDDVDLSDAIGAKVQVKADRGGGGPNMEWAGVFATIEHVHQGKLGAIFRGMVVPPVWFLANGEHSRVFTKMSVKDFASEVMTDAGMISSDFEFRLEGSPATEEFVCQYKESDLAFITRWFEREGLYYFFEHSDDGPKMVITDTLPTTSLRTSGVPYYPTLTHDVTSGEAFQRFRATRKATLSSIKLKDYDYAKPKLDVSGSADGSMKGDIRARVIVIDGKVEGDLYATESVSIRATARVKGNLFAPRVAIMDGAFFQGQIEMQRSGAAVQEHSARLRQSAVSAPPLEAPVVDQMLSGT